MNTDVLVIGSGLAGIRAAVAAKETAPDAGIAVLSPFDCPQGSSFANIHDRLGIQVCHTETERRIFIRDAISIAGPGEINPDLVQVMAKESQDAFLWLQEKGADFVRDSTGNYTRVPGCFSPANQTAYLIRDVRNLYYTLKAGARNCGVEFQDGWCAQEIGIKNQRYRVLARPSKEAGPYSGEGSKLEAKAIILACGGRAALFDNSIAGTGRESQKIHDWCRKNNIACVNEAYTQFVWCRAQDFGNWDIARLTGQGAGFRSGSGKLKFLPAHLLPLFEMRQTHAPVSYGLADRAIDTLLMEQLDHRGSLEVFHPDTGWTRILLSAQASSGGIRIDERGWTGSGRIYACGECTGGMHGANRIGGAMVLSALVFGKRAGQAAVRCING